MERTVALGGNQNGGASLTNPVGSKVQGAAQVAHEITDKVAEQATVQVEHSAKAVHRAVDRTAETVSSAAEWASGISEQARQAQTRLTESASASIRARPIRTVAGALIVGYLVGRLARL
jgi:ElaB/YqjD/DUF883 family membrane-anchored ribosome-binding protein